MTAHAQARTEEAMNVHRIGRFAIAVSEKMKKAHQGSEVRFREIEETPWPAGTKPEEAREAAWQARLNEIRELEPPEGKANTLLETRKLEINGAWAQAARYYGYKDDAETINWDLLLDGGALGVWVTADGVIEEEKEIWKYNLEVAEAYRPPAKAAAAKENWFYLKHGAIALPYLEQEGAYARFEDHPLGIYKFTVETTSVDEVEKVGLLDKITAVIVSGYGQGVKIDRLRTGKRTVAGLKGEEAILRMSTDDDTELSFSWTYPGKEDSGHYPDITINMTAEDGQAEEKTAIWDAMLDSMRPIGR